MTDDGSPAEIPSLADEYRRGELHDEIKVVPVPDDPLEALRSAASDEFESASVAELRTIGV